MYLTLSIATLFAGAVLLAKGLQYLRQGRRFPSRYGGTSSPWLIIVCGLGMLLLSALVAGRL